ncbi:MAG: Crp/Fnr family transcriptional regulator [Chloroflexota bacterium]|nr:Crp/Fnr family transcriptional regulator [Chloroflexota bacterium]
MAALPRAEYTRLRAQMEPIRPRMKSVLYEQGGPIEHVYFPEGGVFSHMIQMADGSVVEVGTIGSEGMIGLSAFLNASASHTTVLCQIAGRALRMSTDVFRGEVTPATRLHTLLHRYGEAFMTYLAQAVACNAVHSAPARCARWLLMMHDRVGGDEFPLTQDFLSKMLGVRRATISAIAQELQAAGMIHYAQGRITIENRAALETITCECYAVVRREFDRMVGSPRG